MAQKARAIETWLIRDFITILHHTIWWFCIISTFYILFVCPVLTTICIPYPEKFYENIYKRSYIIKLIPMLMFIRHKSFLLLANSNTPAFYDYYHCCDPIPFTTYTYILIRLGTFWSFFFFKMSYNLTFAAIIIITTSTQKITHTHIFKTKRK